MKYSTMPEPYKEETKPHYFCPGCGHAIILKLLGESVEELDIQKKSVFAIDIGCSLLAWNFYDIDTIQTHHGRVVPVCVGIKKASPKKNIIAYMGDGGGYAIGLQSLIHSAYRNDPITTIVVNNTNYAMTGGQMAPTTFPGEITSTTPNGKDKKVFGDHFLGPELLLTIAPKSASIERVSISNPKKVLSAIKSAIISTQNGHFSFLEILSVCPTNWKTNAHDSFEFLKTMESFYPVKKFTGVAPEGDK